MHVVTVDELVDAHALLADGVQESRRIPGQDLPDGGVAQHSLQPADDRNQLVRRTAAAGALKPLDSVADAFDGVSDGVRKVAIEQQELENAVWREFGGVDLAVRLEGGA